jgi:hypothetical protein
VIRDARPGIWLAWIRWVSRAAAQDAAPTTRAGRLPLNAAGLTISGP